jgi:methylated-DNA-[protein]-cysteine S-methyltransferase
MDGIDERAIARVARTAAGGEVDVDRLAAEFSARAGAAGLIDVAYATVDTPLGPLLAASTDRGLVQLSFPRYDPDQMLERLAARISPRVFEAPDRFEGLRRELDEYFEGRRRHFDVPLDWQLTRGFVCTVLKRTNRIPYGETRTYAEMATLAGSPRAFRAAGSALGANPIPIVVPCHRVLRSGGGLGGYGGGLDVKRTLLRLEGVLDR